MRIRFHGGTAGDLHQLPMPEGDTAELWVCRPRVPALVMGSAQRPDQFDRQALDGAGIELAARRSGGGAVWIDPMSTVWIDVVAPRTSRWFNDDLAATFTAVGAVWCDALRSLGVAASLAETQPDRSAAARLVCWAGIGWGEVLVDGAKVVGLSQRRTRWGVRVQAMAVLDGSAARAADWFVGRTEPECRDLKQAVGSVVVAIDRDLLEQRVIDAFADLG